MVSVRALLRPLGSPRSLLVASTRIGAKKLTEAGFIDSAGRQLKDGLCGGFLAGRESITIELEKQHADHKTGALVAISKVMILYDACRVLGGKFNNVRAGVRDMIQWPSQSRLKQRGVPYALSATMLDEQLIVDRQY